MHINANSDFGPPFSNSRPQTLHLILPNWLKSFLFLLSMLSYSTNAQSLTSLTGLFNIPSADFIQDKEVYVGVSYLDKHDLPMVNHRSGALAYFVTIGYLPFFEGSIRITRPFGEDGVPFAFGDRMISARIKLFSESEYFPALVFGAHDILWAFGGDLAKHFNSTYLVGTKHFQDIPLINSFALTTGYGISFNSSGNYEFVGLFGGLSIKPVELFEFMLEYDAVHTNSGIRINILNHFKILAGFLQLKYFSGGVAVNFKL